MPGFCFYLFSIVMANLLPFEWTRFYTLHHSDLYTCVFSNLPGPLTKRQGNSPDQISDDGRSISTTSNGDSPFVSEPEHISGVIVPGAGTLPLAITCVSITGMYRIGMTVNKACLPNYKVVFAKLVGHLA